MSLEGFFDPKSVAVVGASRQKGKVGHEIVVNLVRGDFAGEVYPVNPKADEVEGLRCYPDLKSIETPPDLAVISIPAKLVSGVIRECGQVGCKNAIVITAGFKETGKEGRKLEEDLVQTARRAGVRIIGPNCLGILVPGKGLNASFGGDLPATGSIGYLSQSGALLTAILDAAKASGIGFSMLVSIGNKADVDELDMLEAFRDHDETKVIAGYLESVGDGKSFIRLAEEISHRKPILLLKAGGTSAGAKAASSHTGSMAGSETAYEVVFQRAGIVRCDSIKMQFDLAQAFAYQPLPKGKKVAIVTNAGGAGIMATDAVERKELSFAKFSDETVSKLKENLPPAANTSNPVDILGDAMADRYEFAIDAVLDDEDVDVVLVLLTPQAMTDCEGSARAAVAASKRHGDKPVLACFLGGEKVAESVRILREGGVPPYDSPENAVQTIKAMHDYVRWRSRPKRVVKLFPVNRHKAEKVITRHLREGIREIGESEAKAVLEAYGFVTPKGAIATTAEQAANVAGQLGYPVVMKIWSPDITHKTDVGGVRIGLESAQEVRDAFDLMMYRVPQKAPDADILGVLVQEQVTSGKEVILGMHRDPNFGPLLMFGMGGTMVEVLQDVSFHLAPLTPEEAREMLARTRTYQLLQGVRGEEGVDIDVVAEGLRRVSQLVTEFPQIDEMDINPYVVGPEGTTPVAVDARMSVSEKK
ncbi:MAG: acetate--CoA ligase alpha subunit [Phycisphaerae bacterium]